MCSVLIYNTGMNRRKPGFNDDGTPLNGEAVIRAIQDETDTVLMSFSCGKDSLAAWLAIRPRFKTIVPFYLWSVPGLGFIEGSLRYYEDFFQTHILRLPHPSFWRQLNNFMWQPPERIQVIRAAGMPSFNYDDINRFLIQQHDLPDTTFCVSGVRAVDSPNRWASMKQHGPINWKRRYCYPVWDMRKDALIDLLNSHNVKLPVDYAMFGRSFDGVDYRFLKPIQEHYPEDYERILEWFPLARLEIMRYEQ